MAAPVPGRCGFYIEKKNRFCKMIVGKGNVFCGEHGDMEEGNTKRRIPCPLDPKHTVFEERLSRHLKKCNSREKPKPVYYVEDINAGSGDEDTPEDQLALSQRSTAQLELLIEKLKMAVKGEYFALSDLFIVQLLTHRTEQTPGRANGQYKQEWTDQSNCGSLQQSMAP